MLGEILKQARESRNLTVTDIENGTSIRKAYISALEEENWFALPSPVYVKGFIRNYADFLGIDSDALIEEYTNEVQGGAKKPGPPTPPTSDSVAPPDVFTKPEEEKIDIPVKLNTPKHQKSGKKKSGFLMFALLLALICLGAFYYMNKDQAAVDSTVKEETKTAQVEKKEVKEEPKAQPEEEKKEPKAEENKPVKETPAANTPAPSAAPAAAPAQQQTSGVEVTAGFNGNCWTQVIVDGAVVFEDIGQDGQFFTWKGNNTITITAGNAGAIDITHNGKKMGAMGNFGQVAEKVYTKDAAN